VYSSEVTDCGGTGTREEITKRRRETKGSREGTRKRGKNRKEGNGVKVRKYGSQCGEREKVTKESEEWESKYESEKLAKEADRKVRWN
jgi:hypothetical protein